MFKLMYILFVRVEYTMFTEACNLMRATEEQTGPILNPHTHAQSTLRPMSADLYAIAPLMVARGDLYGHLQKLLNDDKALKFWLSKVGQKVRC